MPVVLVNKTTQSLASIGRQVLAIAGIVMGTLTQTDASLHLPTVLSSIFAVGGAIILAIEHYVADPSTGTPSVPPAAVTLPVA
jgi:hypothetical protein